MALHFEIELLILGKNITLISTLSYLQSNYFTRHLVMLKIPQLQSYITEEENFRIKIKLKLKMAAKLSNEKCDQACKTGA